MGQDLYGVLGLLQNQSCADFKILGYDQLVKVSLDFKSGRISKSEFDSKVASIKRAVEILSNPYAKEVYDAGIQFPGLSPKEATVRYCRRQFLDKLDELRNTYNIPKDDPYYIKISAGITKMRNSNIMFKLVNELFLSIVTCKRKYRINIINTLIDVVLSIEDQEELGCRLINYTGAYCYDYIMNEVNDECYSKIIKYLAADIEGHLNLLNNVECFINGANPFASEQINTYIDNIVKRKGLNLEFKPRPSFYVVRPESEKKKVNR